MAARSTLPTGFKVVLGVLGVLVLGLGVTTAIFLAQKNTAQQNYTNLQAEIEGFVRPAERNLDDVRQLVRTAQSERKSVVLYLSDRVRDLTGQNSQVSQNLRAANADVASLRTQLQNAQAEVERAREDRDNEVARVARIEAAFDERVAQLRRDVQASASAAEVYRTDVADARLAFQQAAQSAERDARARESSLNARVRELENQLVVRNETISALQSELRGVRVAPADEFALVDGEVVGLEPGQNRVIINRGRSDKLVLGMTFEVYSSGADIRPNPATGEYPRGKASIEVVRIDDKVATAVITSETRGNPIVRGDVIANALYDPNKSYRFMVFGDFDTNFDGVWSAREARDIEALIRSWGGEIAADLEGSVDFLVLGRRPALPPQPATDAPSEIINRYIDAQTRVQRYDELFRQAVAIGLPVLNENRLYTLTGKRFGLD